MNHVLHGLVINEQVNLYQKKGTLGFISVWKSFFTPGTTQIIYNTNHRFKPNASSHSSSLITQQTTSPLYPTRAELATAHIYSEIETIAGSIESWVESLISSLVCFCREQLDTNSWTQIGAKSTFGHWSGRSKTKCVMPKKYKYTNLYHDG